MNECRELLSLLGEDWESEYIARSEVERFTGGMIKPGTLANLDSRGEGPKGRFRFGNKVIYRKDEFVEWIKNRCEEITKKPKGERHV